jgi:hypothetical protein
MHAVLDLSHIHRAAITCMDNDVGIGAQRLGKLSAIKVYGFRVWGDFATLNWPLSMA